MKRFLVIILVLCIGGFFGCAKKSKKEVVAVINGKEITMAMVDEKIEKFPQYYQAFASQHKKEVVDEIVIEELLYNEAKRCRISRQADVRELIDDAIRKILVSKVVEDEAKKSTPVSEDDAKAYYEEHKDRYMVPEMVRASHILTSTEEEAKKAQAELKAGVDFADVAKKYSKDLTKDGGGDLGLFKKGQMIPEFEKVAFGLNVGEVSDVVKTRFGYHIIKLTDRKPAAYRKFEEVKDSIMSLLSRERQGAKFEEFVNKLKSKAKIKVNEELFTSPQQQKSKEASPAPETELEKNE